MTIKKFPSLEAALAAGYHIDLGNGEYAEGGEILPRERYQALYDALKGSEAPDSDTFSLPDLRQHK